MTAVTPNLKLYVPEFDQVPWDFEVNTNWQVLDAAVGMFTAIPNLVGVWTNSHSYLYGQSVIDPTDSGVWMCVQGHTSSALPQSFTQERTAFPAYWTQTTPGASFYANQAASSAASASASAATAQNAAASVAACLPLAGGTMTGFITLNADPTLSLHAVTKQYVDARVGGTGYLPISGGVLTGNLEVGGNGVLYSNQGANKHVMAFGWNGSAITATVDGTAVGNLATQTFLSGNYIPISGSSSVTGTIRTTGEFQGTVFRLTQSGGYFYSTSGVTQIVMDSANWRLEYNRSNGTLAYIRGSDNVNIFSIDGYGNTYVGGQLTANSGIIANGNIYARSGYMYWGGGDRSHLGSDNSTFTDIALIDNYRWQLIWSSGTLYWLRWDNQEAFHITPNGDTWCKGNSNVSATLTANNITTPNQVMAQQVCAASTGNFYLGWVSGADLHVLNFNPDWYLAFEKSTGDLWYNQYGFGKWIWYRVSDGLLINQRGPCAGLGAYINLSDIRTKEAVTPATVGLREIKQIEPINFVRIGGEKQETGFSAQQVQQFIPEAVHNTNTGDQWLGVSLDPIVVALVNATKELEQRMSALEGK